MSDRTPLAQEIANHLNQSDFDAEGWNEILAKGAELLALMRQKAPLLREDVLDEIVHTYCQDKNVNRLNDTEDGAEQEEIISKGEQDASRYNNLGWAGQIAFILMDAGVEHGEKDIHEAIAT